MLSLTTGSTNSFWKYAIVVPAKYVLFNKMISVLFSLLLLADVYAKDLSNTATKPENSQIKIHPTRLSSVTPSSISHSDSQHSEIQKNKHYFTVPSSSTVAIPTLSFSETSGNSNINLNRRINRRLRHSRHVSHKHHHTRLVRRSCQTKSLYAYKAHATDMFGDDVQIYPYIHIGSLSIDQYFLESFCDQEKCECSGIDSTLYTSSCETDHTFTYARVVKNGEIGWTHIKIRSGCSCKIHKVTSAGHVNIVDLI